MAKLVQLRRRLGGVEGNRSLTTWTAIVLLALLPVELLTLLALRPLLPVHVFVGMLLVPLVALKLASVTYRLWRYYARSPAYVAAGAPALVMRLLGPFVVATTLVLLGSGVALVVLGPGTPFVLTAHKASFVLWAGAMGLHVLGHLRDVVSVPAAWLRRNRLEGRATRGVAIGASVLAGLVLATTTLHLADRWEDGGRSEQHEVR
jgi:hypothetical protein